MKKKIIIIPGILILLAMSWLGYESVKKLDKKEAIRNTQNDLSQMLNQLGQTTFDVAPSTVLIFFNSECEHCQWEMQEISNKIDEFNQYQLLLTSFEPEQEAIAFLNQHGLSDYYVKTTPEKAMAAFTGDIPQILIYQNGKLVRHFRGEVKIAAILGALATK